MSIERTYGNWRKDIERQTKAGEQLEAIAKMHRDILFDCRVHWTPMCLDWCEHGDTLDSFSSRVKQVAARFGPPDSVEGRHWMGAFDDAAPGLVATWKLDAFVVMVRSLRPEGCKIDPRSNYEEAKTTNIHPECAAVLKELEDAGETEGKAECL